MPRKAPIENLPSRTARMNWSWGLTPQAADLKVRSSYWVVG